MLGWAEWDAFYVRAQRIVVSDLAPFVAFLTGGKKT